MGVCAFISGLFDLSVAFGINHSIWISCGGWRWWEGALPRVVLSLPLGRFHLVLVEEERCHRTQFSSFSTST